MPLSRPPLPRPPVFMLVFISMFGFIGLTVLFFVWGGSSHDFGSPPLFFRIFASFIAFAFIAMGFGLPATILFSRRPGAPAAPETGPSANQPAPGYRCPHCGAALGKDADVSPSGDVKCPYCKTWWNLHHRSFPA